MTLFGPLSFESARCPGQTMSRVAPHGKRAEVRVTSKSETGNRSDGGRVHDWSRFQKPHHRFLDSAYGLARNDTFIVPPSFQPDRGLPICPDRESEATFQAVIPTEKAKRRFKLSSRPRERTVVSICHPDRESGANEWRDLWGGSWQSFICVYLRDLRAVFGRVGNTF